jgi:uncharacterized protein (TIGR02118 family)
VTSVYSTYPRIRWTELAVPAGAEAVGENAGRAVSSLAIQESMAMTRLLVLYGRPEDPAAFDQYYREVHIPLAKKMKGLKKWTVGKVQGTPDGEASDYYYVADLYGDSREELEAIFQTPEGQAAVDDVPKFASGGVTFIYTEVEEIIG